MALPPFHVLSESEKHERLLNCREKISRAMIAAVVPPTPGSWFNQVERWFAELTRKQVQRGVHRSVAELEAHIMAFIEAHNDNPKPYRWVKSSDQILTSVKSFCLKTMNRTSIPDD